MMTQRDAETVEALCRKAGLRGESAARVATEALVRSNSGEWGILTWWRDDHHECAEAMPRHDGGDGTWRFTTKGGFELFLRLEDVSEFERSIVQ